MAPFPALLISYLACLPVHSLPNALNASSRSQLTAVLQAQSSVNMNLDTDSTHSPPIDLFVRCVTTATLQASKCASCKSNPSETPYSLIPLKLSTTYLYSHACTSQRWTSYGLPCFNPTVFPVLSKSILLLTVHIPQYHQYLCTPVPVFFLGPCDVQARNSLLQDHLIFTIRLTKTDFYRQHLFTSPFV